MATTYATVKLGGFTSSTSSVAPTGGTQLGALVTIQLLDDGEVLFTSAAGQKLRMFHNSELAELLSMLTVGSGGVPTTKTWHK